jgi:hypothetical protein
MRGALRRIAILVGVIAGITAFVSLLSGLLAGSSVSRSLSVGFYLVGCFLLVLGFFAGVRGPVRPREKEGEAAPLAASFGVGVFWSGVRNATPDELTDTISTAWLMLLLGIGLIAAGVFFDSRVGFT